MEQTLSDLQTQIDRLSLTLHQWRETQEHAQPTEQRLAQLTEHYAELLNRWADTDQRHAHAVSEVESRLRQWNAIEHRLQQDSAQRLQEFEKTVEHEWKELRQIHEEPVKQLREQATALGETCVAAANLALRGFERAEARFAALEADLQGRMTQLSRDLQAVISEMRRGPDGAPALPGSVSPFPLESVMRIHDELREPGAPPPALPSSTAEPVAPEPVAPSHAAVPPAVSSTSPALSDRMETLERELTTEKQEVRDTVSQTERLRRNWRLALGVVALTIIAAGLLGWRLQRRVETHLNDLAAAERRAAAATDLANREITSTREAANREITEARQTASNAQIVTNVLAAPDLVRFNLAGAQLAPRAYGHLLLSRERGIVLGASRVPAPPTGSTYQLWLQTVAGTINGGTFLPDSAGRVTMVSDNPPKVPRGITAIAVTVEPAGGRPAPTGATILIRAQ